MRIKKVTVGIRSTEEILAEAATTMKAVAAGQIVRPKRRRLFFTSSEALRRFVTPKRVDLIHLIRQQKPGAIHELGERGQVLHYDLFRSSFRCTILLMVLTRTDRGSRKLLNGIDAIIQKVSRHAIDRLFTRLPKGSYPKLALSLGPLMLVSRLRASQVKVSVPSL